MPILGRSTLGRYFETGKPLTNQAFVAVVDSFANLNDTTAQEFVSDLIVGTLATPNVSAGEASFTQSLLASGGTLPGLVRHGASGQQGAPVVTQRATALATSQIALLPDSANIVGLGVQVLAVSSGGDGGTAVNIGNGAAIDYFGAITVSAVGNYRLTSVSARRLQGTSGAVYAAGITATANANFVPWVEYYQTSPATFAGFSLVTAAPVSAIGNMGNLGLAFDGVTGAGFGGGAQLASVRAFAGQAWSEAKRIGQFVVWDPSNEGFGSNSTPVTIRLKGNNTNDINTAQTLASVQGPVSVPTISVSVAQSEIDTTIAYPYHWIDVSGGNTIYIAEVQFWELV